MSKVRKFFDLSLTDQLFLVRCLALVALIRLGLNTLTLAKLRQLSRFPLAKPEKGVPSLSEKEVAEARVLGLVAVTVVTVGPRSRGVHLLGRTQSGLDPTEVDVSASAMQAFFIGRDPLIGHVADDFVDLGDAALDGLEHFQRMLGDHVAGAVDLPVGDRLGIVVAEPGCIGEQRCRQRNRRDQNAMQEPDRIALRGQHGPVVRMPRGRL